MKLKMNKLIVSLLFGLVAVALVSAKSRRHPVPDDSNESDDNDGYGFGSDDDDDDEQKAMECFMDMYTCAAPIQQKYQSDNITDAAEHLRQNGLRPICVDATEVGQCVLNVLLDDRCKKVPEDFKDMVTKAYEILNLICVKNIDAIEANWGCLLSAEVDNNLDDCNRVDDGLENCETESFLKCVKTTFAQKDNCKPEAYELVEELVNEIVKLIPECQSPDLRHMLKRAMLMMRRK